MLNNPKWDVMSLEGLIAWLELQPADDKYEWTSPNGCLMGCYLSNRIGSDNLPSSSTYGDMPHYREIASTEPWTFGAALERARSVSDGRYQS